MESMKTNENQWKSHDFRTVAPVTRTIFDEKAFALRDLQLERHGARAEIARQLVHVSVQRPDLSSPK